MFTFFRDTSVLAIKLLQVAKLLAKVRKLVRKESLKKSSLSLATPDRQGFLNRGFTFWERDIPSTGPPSDFLQRI